MQVLVVEVFFSSDDGDKWIERNDSLPAGRVIGITAHARTEMHTQFYQKVYIS